MKLSNTKLAVNAMIVLTYRNSKSRVVRLDYVKTFFLGQVLAMIGIQKQIAAITDDKKRNEQLATFKKMCAEVGSNYSKELAALGTL